MRAEIELDINVGANHTKSNLIGVLFLRNATVRCKPSLLTPGLLHPWVNKDCSLYTNELVYSPPSAPHASPWPGLVGRTSASMTLVAGPPVPTSEVAFRALRALIEASVGTAAHRGDTERATAALTT